MSIMTSTQAIRAVRELAGSLPQDLGILNASVATDALLDLYTLPFDGNLLVNKFAGWVPGDKPGEWCNGIQQHFDHNGGFDAFVGVIVRQDPNFRWYSATRYHGNIEPSVLFHSTQLDTIDDFVRLAQRQGIPAQFV